MRCHASAGDDRVTRVKSKEAAQGARSRQHCRFFPHACSLFYGLRQHLAGLERLCKTTWHTCTTHVVEGTLHHAHNVLLTVPCDACMECCLQQTEMCSADHEYHACDKKRCCHVLYNNPGTLDAAAWVHAACPALPCPALNPHPWVKLGSAVIIKQ